MFGDITTKKVFKGIDDKGRQVIKALVYWPEENTEVEGIIQYTSDDEPVLRVTSETIFSPCILKLEHQSLQRAYDEYERVKLSV